MKNSGINLDTSKNVNSFAFNGEDLCSYEPDKNKPRLHNNRLSDDYLKAHIIAERYKNMSLDDIINIMYEKIATIEDDTKKAVSALETLGLNEKDDEYANNVLFQIIKSSVAKLDKEAPKVKSVETLKNFIVKYVPIGYTMEHTAQREKTALEKAMKRNHFKAENTTQDITKMALNPLNKINEDDVDFIIDELMQNAIIYDIQKAIIYQIPLVKTKVKNDIDWVNIKARHVIDEYTRSLTKMLSYKSTYTTKTMIKAFDKIQKERRQTF